MSKSQKTQCLNLNTGGSMNIDKTTYEIFSRAIYHALKGHQPLTFTELVDQVKDCFKKEGTAFKGSVSWYALTVKHDMVARKQIDVFTEKGRKLLRLAK